MEAAAYIPNGLQQDDAAQSEGANTAMIKRMVNMMVHIVTTFWLLNILRILIIIDAALLSLKCAGQYTFE